MTSRLAYSTDTAPAAEAAEHARRGIPAVCTWCKETSTIYRAEVPANFVCNRCQDD